MKVIVGFLVVIMLSIVGYGALVALAQPASPHPFFGEWRAQRFPIVIADRGGMGLWPENTLYAFERAAALGVDMLEMDVRSTADGALVLMQDRSVNRTTDGTGSVASMTLEDLQSLDAGHNWSSDGGITFPFRDQGVMVPTLEEVFVALPDVHMAIEINQAEPSLVSSLCVLIRKHHMAEKVLVLSVSSDPMKQLRSVCPEVATAASEAEVRVFSILNLAFLGATYQPDFQALQLSDVRSGLHKLTPFFLDTAHGRNLRIYVEIMHEEDDIQRMVDLGVDGITTKYPDQALALLGR